MTANFEPDTGVGQADPSHGHGENFVHAPSPSRRAFIATGAAIGLAAWTAPQLRRFGGATAGAGTLGLIAIYPVAVGLGIELICSGPDGALWFTNDDSSIGRITTGGSFSYFAGTGISLPYGICSGPDGALWFTNRDNGSIGRIDAITDAVTNHTGTGISYPWGICAGPDGALWFTNTGSSSIGRVTTDGTVTNYTGTDISVPYGICPGPDGALWFTNPSEAGNDSIGRVDTAASPS